MSKFLLDEPSLQVQPSLAIAIGLNEAIALQQLHWVLQNPAMGKIVDGKKYVHMSYKEWRKGHFPFWSEATIQRTFDVLIKKKLVGSRGDLNTLSFDRTHWYTINHAEVAKVEESLKTNERVIEHSKMIDGHCKMKNASKQNETTIPDTSLPESSAPENSNSGAKPAPPPESASVEQKSVLPDKESPLTPAKLPDAPVVVEAKRRIGEILDAAGGLRPEVADPREAEKAFVKEFSPLMGRIFRREKPISEDRSATRDIYQFHCDPVWLAERLTAYANGQGEQYRRPAKDGKMPCSYWVRNDIEKEWSVVSQERRDAEQREREQADYERRVAAALASVSPSEQDGGRSYPDSVHLHDPARGPGGNAVRDAAGQAGVSVATGGNVRVRGDGLGVLPVSQPPVGAEDGPGEAPQRSRSVREMYRDDQMRRHLATLDAEISKRKRAAA